MKQAFKARICIALCCLLILALSVEVVRGPFQAAPAETQAQEKASATTGDTNGDGKLDIADALYLLSYLFKGGEEPVPCAEVPVKQPRCIFVLRHAEKASTPPGDPPLTAEGKQRAERIADIFAHQRVDKIYASELKRTYQTVKPLSDRKGVPIERFNHLSEMYKLIECLNELEAGAVAVVAGHSYSIGDILQGLNIDPPPQISGHNQLFEVLLPANTENSSKLLYLTYQ